MLIRDYTVTLIINHDYTNAHIGFFKSFDEAYSYMHKQFSNKAAEYGFHPTKPNSDIWVDDSNNKAFIDNDTHLNPWAVIHANNGDVLVWMLEKDDSFSKEFVETNIKRFNKDTIEYARLKFAADVFTYLANEWNLKIKKFCVIDIHFDYDQKWVWTTIQGITPDGGFQMLDLQDHTEILSADDDNIYNICKDILRVEMNRCPELFRNFDEMNLL